MAFLVDFTGYFDDSGTDANSEVAVCAGYVATAEQWAQLARNWAEVDDTEKFGVFHTSDCLGGFQQFAEWTKDRKQSVLKRLIGITNLRVRHGFISAVIKRDYDEIVPEWLKARIGKYHYTFCAWSCFAFISQWRQKNGLTEPMQLIFDTMGKGKGEIINAYDSFIAFGNADYIGAYKNGLAFESKELFPQLQARILLLVVPADT